MNGLMSSVPVEEVIASMGSGIYDNGIMMMAGFFLQEAYKRPELVTTLKPNNKSKVKHMLLKPGGI